MAFVASEIVAGQLRAGGHRRRRCQNVEAIVRVYVDPSVSESISTSAHAGPPRSTPSSTGLIATGDIRRINIWSRDGRVVYSTESEPAGPAVLDRRRPRDGVRRAERRLVRASRTTRHDPARSRRPRYARDLRADPRRRRRQADRRLRGLPGRATDRGAGQRRQARRVPRRARGGRGPARPAVAGLRGLVAAAGAARTACCASRRRTSRS